jgi:hypothetical protein
MVLDLFAGFTPKSSIEFGSGLITWPAALLIGVWLLSQLVLVHRRKKVWRRGAVPLCLGLLVLAIGLIQTAIYIAPEGSYGGCGFSSVNKQYCDDYLNRADRANMLEQASYILLVPTAATALVAAKRSPLRKENQ